MLGWRAKDVLVLALLSPSLMLGFLFVMDGFERWMLGAEPKGGLPRGDSSLSSARIAAGAGSYGVTGGPRVTFAPAVGDAVEMQSVSPEPEVEGSAALLRLGGSPASVA
jgi:hypothetical protein